MRSSLPERRAFEHIQALAGLGLGPRIALTEAALALGAGPFAGVSSVVAIRRADLGLNWSFSDAPAFDAHVWRYFARLARIEKRRHQAARALEFAVAMPVLSTADYPALVKRTTIYRELMVPCEVEHILRILIPGAEDCVYSFAFGRPRKAPSFTAADKAFAVHVLPLLAKAAGEATGTAVGGEAPADEGFLLFGGAGTMPDATPGTDQLLRLAGGGGEDGYVAGLETAAALTRTLARDPQARQVTTKLPTPFGTFEFRAQGFGEPALRTIVAVRRSAPAEAMALRACAAMDFPLRQMELASRLAAGATIEQTAAGLGLKVTTARNYTRLIYARLGVVDREGLTRVLVGA